MMEKKWLYFGVFLDEKSRKVLRERFANEIPEGWRVYCDHMTMAFNKNPDAQALFDTCKEYFGKEYLLTINGWGISDKALAARVITPLPSLNKTPHITMAVAPDGKPVESNYITNWNNLKEQDEITISGTLNVVYAK